MNLLNKSSFDSFLMGGLLCMGLCFCMGSMDSRKINDHRPLVESVTVTPEVPLFVSFCGEEIDLSPYYRHEAFDRELSSFTYFHSTTMLLFKRANRFFPVIEPILKAYGIPDDMKYLAVIESHLDPFVISSAKAVGMWQLLEGTAKDFGLTVTATIDERCDVVKSTIAACRFMNAAYKKYGKWTAVASSYNAGMARISSEKEKQSESDVLDLWLVEETSRYIYRIMAIKQIFESPRNYGFVFQSKDLYKPYENDTILLNSDTDLVSFAKSHGVTYADLKRCNPWLKSTSLVTGGKTFGISIPKKNKMSYENQNEYVHHPDWVMNNNSTLKKDD